MIILRHERYQVLRLLALLHGEPLRGAVLEDDGLLQADSDNRIAIELRRGVVSCVWLDPQLLPGGRGRGDDDDDDD